jgi:hypothetical protein
MYWLVNWQVKTCTFETASPKVYRRIILFSNTTESGKKNTYIHTFIYIHTHITLTFLRTCIHTHIHTKAHTYSYSLSLSLSLTHTHIHTHIKTGWPESLSFTSLSRLTQFVCNPVAWHVFGTDCERRIAMHSKACRLVLTATECF